MLLLVACLLPRQHNRQRGYLSRSPCGRLGARDEPSKGTRRRRLPLLFSQMTRDLRLLARPRPSAGNYSNQVKLQRITLMHSLLITWPPTRAVE